MSGTESLSTQELLERISLLKAQVGVAPSPALVAADDEKTAESPVSMPVKTAADILKVVELEYASTPQPVEIKGARRAVIPGYLTAIAQRGVAITAPIGAALEKGIQAETMTLDSESESLEPVREALVDTDEFEASSNLFKHTKGVDIPEITHLGPEEGQRVVGTVDFGKFFSSTSEKTMRLLNASKIVDVMALATDTTGVGSSTRTESSGDQYGLSATSIGSYSCDATDHRFIYDLSIPRQGNDRVLAAYGRKTKNESDFDSAGLACLWNLLRDNEPERMFEHTGALTAITSNPFQPEILVGGDDAGGLLMWDLRERSQLPVSWTTLEETGHQMMIIKAAYTGSAAAYQITTLDQEGLICSWNPSSFSKPSMTMRVQRPTYSSASASNKASDLSSNILPTTAIPNPGEATRLTIGCYDGSIVEASPKDDVGSSGIDHVIAASSIPDPSSTSLSSSALSNPFGHSQQVAAMDWVNTAASLSLPRLLLSGGFDGRVMLWNAYSTSSSKKSSSGNHGAALRRKPLFSYSYPKFITDLSSHPQFPGVFACSGAETLDFWSLGTSTAAPLHSIAMGDRTETITSLNWTPDGTRLWSSDLSGKINLYGIKTTGGLDRDSALQSLENSLAAELDRLD